jgi:hypothetical protein
MDDEEDELPLLEGDPLLERTVQLYLELRLVKRPPESVGGATRKAMRWLEEEAAATGRVIEPEWPGWLERAFLDVEGDVKEQHARRRHARRTAPSPLRPRTGTR